MGDKYGFQKWNYQMVTKLIYLRGNTYAHLFVGKNCNYVLAWKKIQKGFDQIFTYEQVKKKWYNMISKYKRMHALQAEGSIDPSIAWPHYESVHRIVTRQRLRNQELSNDEDSDEPSEKRIKTEMDLNATEDAFLYPEEDEDKISITYYDSYTEPEEIVVQPENNSAGKIRCSSFAYSSNFDDSQPSNENLNGNNTQNTTSKQPPPLIIPSMPKLALIKPSNSPLRKSTTETGEKLPEDGETADASNNSVQISTSERYRNFTNFIYSELMAMTQEQAEKLMKDITKSYMNVKYE